MVGDLRKGDVYWIIGCSCRLFNILICVKQCQDQASFTLSDGMCPPLCLRGGLGRTRVTWWRGSPCVGSSDRPSQDAERDSGDEYDGTEGGGEELESSHRPDGSKEQQRGREDVRTRNWEGTVKEWGDYRESSFLLQSHQIQNNQ